MTDEEIRSVFEEWFSEEYSSEMRRGLHGRSAFSFKMHDGEYVSDRVRNDFKVWCAAYKRMNK